jgi:hypothetical protein
MNCKSQVLLKIDRLWFEIEGEGMIWEIRFSPAEGQFKCKICLEAICGWYELNSAASLQLVELCNNLS